MFQYVNIEALFLTFVIIFLGITTLFFFTVLAEAKNHDVFSIGCVVAGLGYGAITSCWEAAVQEFVGARKWPKLHSALETLSATLLAIFVLGQSFLINYTGDVQYSMFVLGIMMSIATFIWMILAAVAIYVTKVSSFRFGSRF